MTTTADRPDPGRLMQMSWSFAAPLLVEAGVRTGLFDLLGGEPRTIEQTAAATGASKRGLAVLMYALAGLELLHRDETDRFGLTPESAAFLVSTKPEANLGRIFSHISTQLIPAWLDLVEAVRTGRPATRRNNLPERGAPNASRKDLRSFGPWRGGRHCRIPCGARPVRTIEGSILRRQHAGQYRGRQHVLVRRNSWLVEGRRLRASKDVGRTGSLAPDPRNTSR